LAKDEHRDGGGGGDPNDATHAADEPTAVWDFEALRKAGLSEVAQLPEAKETGPATPADGMAQKRASMIVEDEKLDDAPAPPAEARGSAREQNQEASVAPVAPQLARPAPQAPGDEGMGWLSLMALAALFGAIAYAAIRFLR
jgi:hypothetical protein